MPLKQICITDLTRFKPGNPSVCTAGVDSNGILHRPMPYLTFTQCAELALKPGSVLQGTLDFVGAASPHCEDTNYQGLSYAGNCSSETFRKVLLSGLQASVTDGFEYDLPSGHKHIPHTARPPRSIITIRVAPKSFQIVEDGFDSEKLRATFVDSSGQNHAFISITDRGFYDHAVEIRQTPGLLQRLNEFIHEQDELLLRLGLSRLYRTGEREGYWIQVNGIYTFPNYQKHIRDYGDKGTDWEF